MESYPKQFIFQSICEENEFVVHIHLAMKQSHYFYFSFLIDFKKGGAQSKTNQDPEVRNKVINVIKRKIWDLVYQSQQFLSKGNLNIE